MTHFLKRQYAILRQWIAPNLGGFLSAQMPLMWLLALTAGVASGAAAVLFRKLIGLVQLPWINSMSERVASLAADQPFWIVLFAPAAGGLLVGMTLQYLLPTKRTGGIADVIETRAHGARGIAFWPGIVSAVASGISLGAGASAGREGPVVHLGATIAAGTANLFSLSAANRRTLLACGAAGAIAASFNTPIAGVLFAHEVILAHFAPRAFVPVVISAVSATVLSRQWIGDYAAFAMPLPELVSYWEMPAFALLGVVAALVALLFQFSLIGADWVARNIEMPLWTRPIVGGLLVGAIALAFPEVLGVGYEATDKALHQRLALDLMLMLIAAKTVATSITLAARFGGGVVAPSLYLGAMTGGSFGLIAAAANPGLASSHGTYAILGMGAVAAAVLGAPISTIVMALELTGGYELAIALLLTVSIATGITYAVHGRSFFHWQLEMRGVVMQHGAHQHLVRTVRVNDFMVPAKASHAPLDADALDGLPTLKLNDTLETALKAFDNSGLSRIVVVNPAGRIIGHAEQVTALRYFNSALIDSDKEAHR